VHIHIREISREEESVRERREKEIYNESDGYYEPWISSVQRRKE